MTYRLSSRSRPLAFAAWLLALALLTLGAAQNSFAQISLLGSSQAASGAVVTTPRVRAELVAHAPDGVTPGRPLWLGLLISHQPEWHTYWKNPGDSGLATQLQWQLPAGLEAGDIQWPLPKTIRVGTLANYGYEGQLLLPVPFTVAPDFQAPAGDTLTLRVHASWLVCRVECIPEEGDFRLQLPLRGATAMHAPAFAAALAQQPAELQGRGSAKVAGERLQVRITGLPAALQGQELTLFPETPEVLEHAALPGSGWTQAWDGADWTADWPLSAMRGETPKELPFVVAPASVSASAPASGPVAWRSVAMVEGQWASAPVAGVSPALAAALAANAQQAPATPPAGTTGFWFALLGGLVGGLILNLMPCVFPVLAIKIVGFARHGQDRRALRLSGLAYGAGVLLSFLALGGLLLALRAAGQQLGWGFQLQSPGLVAAMALLFTLLGLNLAGMFEFGRMLPQRWAGAQLRHPTAEAFLSGVLAVAIASPCTAPFMGASLGLAIDMPAAQALTVFAALGVGMALPYVLASFLPALVRWLPRPGAWMDTFRRAMAFPMFATVAWLVWVLGQQSGIDGAGALLVLLVALSALVWALTLTGRTRWLLGSLVLLGSLWLGSAVGPHITRVVAGNAQASSGDWQPWSDERVRSLTAAGTPVFVDFTAAWCVTCQVNKHTTLNQDKVRADFAARGVTLLRADWTRRDPAITAALTALGRSGVPVYVLYAPGKPPHVMTELLSPAEVHAALKTL